MLGSAAVEDGDPRLHDTAAHSLTDGAGAATVMMEEPPDGTGNCASIDPGTRQLTATAARVTSSHCHLGATGPRLRLPVCSPDAGTVPVIADPASGGGGKRPSERTGQCDALVGPERSRAGRHPHQRLRPDDGDAADPEGPCDETPFGIVEAQSGAHLHSGPDGGLHEGTLAPGAGNELPAVVPVDHEGAATDEATRGPTPAHPPPVALRVDDPHTRGDDRDVIDVGPAPGDRTVVVDEVTASEPLA
jgi:hypothetical protein